MLGEWLIYVDEITKLNHETLNHNKVVRNKVAAEDAHYNNMADLYNGKLEEWHKRGWRDFFDTPPVPPNHNQHMEIIRSLESELKQSIYPDFTGFMNHLIKKRGLLNGRD